MTWDNNPDWYQHKAPVYAPKWEKLVNYSPDANPSAGAIYTQGVGGRIIRIYRVAGLGVLIQEADTRTMDAAGKLLFSGCSILTKEEIGYAPDI